MVQNKSCECQNGNSHNFLFSIGLDNTKSMLLSKQERKNFYAHVELISCQRHTHKQLTIASKVNKIFDWIIWKRMLQKNILYPSHIHKTFSFNGSKAIIVLSQMGWALVINGGSQRFLKKIHITKYAIAKSKA